MKFTKISSCFPLYKVTHWVHFICSCSIIKCPQVVYIHATCLPPLVALDSTVCTTTSDPTVALTASPSCTLQWHIKKGKLMVIAINRLPAPSCLPDAIHCVCKTGCNTRHCGCCKYELECSLYCGGCKGLHCLNITLPGVGKSYRYWHNNYIETILFSH